MEHKADQEYLENAHFMLEINFCFTSDSVDRNSIDRVVNPEPEEQLVRSYEHGPGHQPHQERRPGGEQVTASTHRHCRRQAPVHTLE